MPCARTSERALQIQAAAVGRAGARLAAALAAAGGAVGVRGGAVAAYRAALVGAVVGRVAGLATRAPVNNVLCGSFLVGGGQHWAPTT